MKDLKVYTDVDKVFTCGQFSITRQEYELMSCMMMAELCDDDTMQAIVNDIYAAMYQEYSQEELDMLKVWHTGVWRDTLSIDDLRACEKMNKFEFENFKECALAHGMVYWEDLTEEEQDYLEKNYNF